MLAPLRFPPTDLPLPLLKTDDTNVVEVGDDLVPVFDGVPILVDDPAAWCGRHKEAIVSALVGAGVVVGQETLAVIEAMAAQAPRQTSALFVDDFTPEEAVDFPPPQLVDDDLQQLVDDATTPFGWLAQQLVPAKVVVEVGPGAGGLTSVIAPLAEQLIVVDISLRSVLLARARARATATSKPRRDAIVGVVAAADVALPVLDDSVDLIVAENVVDVVDDPSGLLSAFALALKPGGTLLLTSPDPDLGTMPSDPDDDETDGDEEEPALFALLDACGFDVVDDVDGLRWPRVHGPRHVEVWTCVGLRCVKR